MAKITRERIDALFSSLSPFEKGIDDLKKASRLTDNAKVRYAVMMWNMPGNMPGEKKEWTELRMLLLDNFFELSFLFDWNADELVYMLERLDAFRRKDRFNEFLLCVECIYSRDHAEHIRGAYDVASNIDVTKIIDNMKNL